MKSERNVARSIVRWALGLSAVLSIASSTTFAFAQAEAGVSNGPALMRLLDGVVATVVYALIGIVMVMIGYKVFCWMLPFSVKKELEEDHNVSVGILLAALVLGICIVVAATIHS